MASALDALVNNYQTSSPVSFYDYYNAYGRDHSKNTSWLNTWQDADPYSFSGRLDNFFSGTRKSAEADYQKYLSEYEYRRNSAATELANKQTWAREDSQVQRLMEDYQKAGLNPYALLVGGNISSGVVSSQAQKPEYQRGKFKERDDKKSSTLGTALKLLAILALKG